MKVLKTALLFLMCVSFSFSCKEGVKEVRVLKLAHGLSPSHSVHLGLLYMNERLKELSGGKMSMDIYSSAQLGSENQCIELLQIGSLDITKVSSAALEGFADPFKVFVWSGTGFAVSASPRRSLTGMGARNMGPRS